MQRRQFVQVLAALPLGSSALTGMAQIVGDKPLQIIVPFGPGGSGDITARMLAEFITKKTGRPAMVDNRPGANGIVGVEAVRKSPSDGSVVLLATTSTHSANPSLYKKLPYDPERDFTLVGHFGGSSSYMLVKPNAPYKTLADFVQAAKAAPGKLNYGYFNASSQVPGALLGQVAGIELTAIPYKQVNTAMTELIAGQIDVIFVDSVAGDSFVSSGQLRALAAQSAKRLVKYPSVPLISETYPSYGVSGFLGIAVPAGTPATTLQLLNDLINEAITTDPMRARLEGFGFSPKKMSLSQLATFDKEERAKWKNYVAIARMEPQ
ncbi:tripartite tricarboxylate transporter substrate binding protein [Polaromonas sp. SM01]|uniref:Bug family tripartite tricarboxylate transporter substrate binding protein n=1 Tax=Polaromonas sp. SM01 TaxID=3085630 RepID=UPI0029821117|nr:tripartite tricarboxylate transporter substrate binding protein [Polaromonas sp. SM01]MDW5445027.1 tripartite tricarboxylate transporter substrate binding protein [Polaromonas sp. SM01]